MGATLSTASFDPRQPEEAFTKICACTEVELARKKVKKIASPLKKDNRMYH